MVTKVAIKDNTRSPIRYINSLDNFKNGTEYIFKPGVNIIVGENGCGKTTLMNLIKAYLLVDYEWCDKGIYNCNINYLFRDFESPSSVFDGVDVFADYTFNTFRLSHKGEKRGDLENIRDISINLEQSSSSTGESVLVAISALFNYMFDKDTKLTFDYHQQVFKDYYSSYIDYVDNHTVKEYKEITILMDEPDRNLSLDNLKQIEDILSFHKENTQIISVIHNPLLIYALSKNSGINFIEMTKGYINKIKKQVDNLLK